MITKDFKMKFGKYRGLSLRKILYIDPSYILWLNKENVLEENIDSEVIKLSMILDYSPEQFDWLGDYQHSY